MISIVITVYNDAERVEEAVNQTEITLSEFIPSFEIIIAEDGNTDGTAEIASRIAREKSFVKHIHNKARLGRGKALSNAFKLSKGEIVAYLDVDLSTNMKHLKELINAIKNEDYDIAIGSRMLKESEVKRTFKRYIMSKGFNFLTKVILHSKIKDHQCGFKSFRKDILMNFLDEIEDEHWFWDTEMLILAQRSKYRIKEIPVKWEDKGTKTNVRTFHDSFVMLSKIIGMRLK